MPDVSPVMRGTIGSIARLDGYRDTVVEGYGLVVNLDGTGHRTMNASVRAHMIGEMSKRGVGSERMGFNVPPEQVLDSTNTAVVVVRGIIPPGSVEGERFDIHVSKLPNTETTSLEGGTLWTVDLRPSLGPGLPPTGSRQARAIAKARGQIFTNPFIEPGDTSRASISSGTNIDTTTGRILGGGVVTRPIPLKLRLASPSHNTASLLQQVVNSQFPQEPGQRQPTAWGEGDESIEITVPPSYRGDQREFVRLLQHTSLNLAGTELTVQYINRVVEQVPSEADNATWRWQAIGREALPAIKSFYSSPDERPRFAALRAGAELNDPLVIPHLLDLAKIASPGVRVEAINLLGDMRTEPQLVYGLRELLNDDDTQVRVAAYEAMANHRTAVVETEIIDRKFRLDLVESDNPMVYVALFDEPRIVLFDKGLAIKRPLTMSTWSNRLMIKGDYGEDFVEVAYRDEDTGQLSLYREIPADLRSFIRFLGHTSTIEEPAPGLGLSYSKTIGVLYALYRGGYLNDAEFLTEADRLRMEILNREQDTSTYEERPEFEMEGDASDGPDAGTTPTDDLPENQIPSSSGRNEFGRPIGIPN